MRTHTSLNPAAAPLKSNLYLARLRPISPSHLRSTQPHLTSQLESPANSASHISARISDLLSLMGRQSMLAGAIGSSSGKDKAPLSKRPASPQLDQARKRKSKVGLREILFVTIDELKQHIGYSSLDENTRFILAPSDVSRENGDMAKDSPICSPDREVNVFNMEKPYVFGRKPQFLTTQAKSRYEELKSKRKKPIPFLYPDLGVFEKLGVLEDISDTLKGSGLHFILREDPGSYPEVTLEFLSYFRPIFVDDDDEKEVMCWRFGLGKYYWEVDANVLRDWLRFPYDGIIPKANPYENRDFWFEISGARNHKTTSIKVHKWKIIHKLLGGTIFVRANYGRTVTPRDLTIMLMMKRRTRVDWLWCLSHGLLDNLNMTSRNLQVGGGSIVTMIAKKLGYVFHGENPKMLKMTVPRLKRMYILGVGLKWKEVDDEVVKKKGKKVVVEEEEENEEEDNEDEGNEDDDEQMLDVGASSSAARGYTLESLGKNFEDLNLYAHQQFAWQADHNIWQQNTLMAFAEKWGVDVDLPPSYPYDEDEEASDEDEQESADSP